MTIRNLEALFEPKAIALIGASNHQGSVGAVVARNLLAGGFSGPIMPVNPHGDAIHSVVSYASISALPHTADLAVIATPAETVPGLVAELAQTGCRAAIIISAGLDREARAQMFAAAAPHLLRILGPNCLGFLSPAKGINASFAHIAALPGDIALVTQSGAVATSMLDWAVGRGIGFSHIVSLGDMNDIDFGDLLDYLALDPATKSILLYVENITHARKFMSAARIAARAKPVIIVKSGRSEAGARAAASHTGALAGADAVYDAAFRRAGALRVKSLRDMFEATITLASGLRPRGDRLTILTNGGGLGVLAADAHAARGGALATLSAETIAELDAKLPPSWSHGNPIDILGDAHADRYAAALVALADTKHDGVLVINCPTGVADTMEAAQAVVEFRRQAPNVPVLACWMGEETAQAPRRRLAAAGAPVFETPEEAVDAFSHLVDYARNQEALLETPSASGAVTAPAIEKARAIIAKVIGEGRNQLSEPEAKAVVSAFGVAIAETKIARTPREAAAAASAIGGSIVLKILSRDISHKSDVGGVALNLTADVVEIAAEQMLSTVSAAAPAARLDGFAVQPMIKRPRAFELIVGALYDPTFGPVIMFGHGGVAVEVLADRAIGLAPLNGPLARDMIARTRIAKLLAGFRDWPAANLTAIENVLTTISDMVIALPEIVELDINPLLADADGVLALDARIIVKPYTGGESDARLAIRPYPAHLAREIVVDGAPLLLRPIKPEDAERLADMGRRTAPEDLRLRFHGAVRPISVKLAAQLTQIDYDRSMAFVAAEANGDLAGVGRLEFNPDFETGEYAVIVRSDLQKHGLGEQLIRVLLDYAKARGARVVWGEVLRENTRMIDLATALGATLHAVDGQTARIEFALG